MFDQADEETQSSLIFLLVLQDIYESTNKCTGEEIDEINLEAPDLIPERIAAILLVPRARSEQALWPKRSLLIRSSATKLSLVCAV